MAVLHVFCHSGLYGMVERSVYNENRTYIRPQNPNSCHRRFTFKLDTQKICQYSSSHPRIKSIRNWYIQFSSKKINLIDTSYLPWSQFMWCFTNPNQKYSIFYTLLLRKTEVFNTAYVLDSQKRNRSNLHKKTEFLISRNKCLRKKGGRDPIPLHHYYNHLNHKCKRAATTAEATEFLIFIASFTNCVKKISLSRKEKKLFWRLKWKNFTRHQCRKDFFFWLN